MIDVSNQRAGPVLLSHTQELRRLIETVSRVFIGKEEVVAHAVLTLAAGGHVLLEDLPGLGKTLLAKALARAVSLDFKRIQFTADLLPSDITGVTIFSQETHQFTFRKGPIFTQILLGDEINRATPRTQSSLLEAMEEESVTVDGVLYDLPPPFFVIATQNPVELEGTYPLPFAQMDRFMCRLSIGYLEKSAEIQMLRLQQNGETLQQIRPAMNAGQLLKIREAVRQVTLRDSLLEYLVNIVRASRDSDQVEYGASPRGSLDCQRFSQALALLDGRDYVLPDDIKKSARMVLPHRLIIRKGARNVSLNAASLMQQMVDSVPVPV